MTAMLRLSLAALLASAFPAFAQDDDPAPLYPRTEFAEGAMSATVSSGGISATVSMERRPVVDPDAPVPVLTIMVDGRAVFEMVGAASGMGIPTGEASIAEIDPGNRRPEVYFSSYTGGAHCCSDVVVVTETAAGWKAVPIGVFDGDGSFLDDLDNDGEAEIAPVDNDFLYTFDCYACSAAPLRIYVVRDGIKVDATAEPRFLSAHRDWLRELEDGVDPEERWTSPGFLAGWVAAKARVGEGAAAFAEMERHWDIAGDEGEEVCLTGQPIDECPRRQKQVMKFPERLKRFLTERGYPI